MMCLLNMNFGSEMIFILLLAFLMFGPKKLPEIARTLGKFMAEFKKASSQFQGQIHEEIRKLDIQEADPRKHIAPELAKLTGDEDLSLTGALNRLTDRIKNTVPQDHDA
jgi:TatA/E family protein of Tat protein translocase